VIKFVVVGKQLRLSSGLVLDFEYAVAEVLETANVLIVRLEIPPGETMNRNVFGINREDGRVRWQVPERKLVYEDSPYTGLRRDGVLVTLCNWDGMELRIDPRSGEVLEESHGR
jgi:hypothetical protein